jgi:hypothetical protein
MTIQPEKHDCMATKALKALENQPLVSFLIGKHVAAPTTTANATLC